MLRPLRNQRTEKCSGKICCFPIENCDFFRGIESDLLSMESPPLEAKPEVVRLRPRRPESRSSRTGEHLGSIVLGVIIIAFGGKLRAEDLPPSAMTKLITNIKAGETNYETIIVKGKCVSSSYDAAGQLTYARVDRQYVFSRDHKLMKVEREGDIHLPGKDPERKVIPVDELVFYAPNSTVYLSNKRTIARVEERELPSPFPLEFGINFTFGSDGEVKCFSDFLEESLKLRKITLGVDPKYPSLIFIDDHAGRARFKYWIDPLRGYLVVRKEVFLVSVDSLKEVLFEYSEVKPKQYDGVWFMESGRRVRRNIVHEDEKTGDVVTSREELAIQVSKFETNPIFVKDEMVFNPRNFPYLSHIFLPKTNERINLRTGVKTKWLDE